MEHKSKVRTITLHAFLAELETETLAMSRGSSELEMLPPHASHSSHPSSSEESLEYAVGVDIMEAVPSPILQVLAAVIHPPLLLVTQYGICFSNLEQMQIKIELRLNLITFITYLFKLGLMVFLLIL